MGSSLKQGLHLCSLGEVTTHGALGLSGGETVWGPPTSLQTTSYLCVCEHAQQTHWFSPARLGPDHYFGSCLWPIWSEQTLICEFPGKGKCNRQWVATICIPAHSWLFPTSQPPLLLETSQCLPITSPVFISWVIYYLHLVPQGMASPPYPNVKKEYFWKWGNGQACAFPSSLGKPWVLSVMWRQGWRVQIDCRSQDAAAGGTRY